MNNFQGVALWDPFTNPDDSTRKDASDKQTTEGYDKIQKLTQKKEEIESKIKTTKDEIENLNSKIKELNKELQLNKNSNDEQRIKITKQTLLETEAKLREANLKLTDNFNNGLIYEHTLITRELNKLNSESVDIKKLNEKNKDSKEMEKAYIVTTENLEPNNRVFYNKNPYIFDVNSDFYNRGGESDQKLIKAAKSSLKISERPLFRFYTITQGNQKYLMYRAYNERIFAKKIIDGKLEDNWHLAKKKNSLWFNTEMRSIDIIPKAD